MDVQEHCLNVIYYYRIKIFVIVPSDIQLFCYVQDIDLCINRIMIIIKEENTYKIVQFILDLEIVRT